MTIVANSHVFVSHVRRNPRGGLDVYVFNNVHERVRVPNVPHILVEQALGVDRLAQLLNSAGEERGAVQVSKSDYGNFEDYAG